MLRAPLQVEDEVPAGASVGWMDSLRAPQTWGFALGKFLTDPVWWFYLYWLPPYLYDVRKFDLKQIGWALPVVSAPPAFVLFRVAGVGCTGKEGQ